MASDISALDSSFPLSQLRVVFTGMIPGDRGEPSPLWQLLGANISVPARRFSRSSRNSARCQQAQADAHEDGDCSRDRV